MPLINQIEELNACAPPGYELGLGQAQIDDLVTALIESYRTSDRGERSAAVKRLTREGQQLLLDFAWEQAAESVRRRSGGTIANALAALSIEDGQYDLRDSIVRMAVLFRSAEKLGLDASTLFAEAADLALSTELQRALSSFPHRPPEHRDLGKAFYIRERVADGRFTYERDPEGFARAVRRKVWFSKWRRVFRHVP